MLSSKLKQLRSDTNLTQSDFAKKIGVARTTYAMYEQGNREPDYETLKKIANFYDVSADYLLGTSNDKESKMNINVAGKEFNLSPEEIEVFNELRKHPNLFHDLASNPEKKVKELIKLYTMKKMFLEDDDEDPGEGFGSIKD